MGKHFANQPTGSATRRNKAAHAGARTGGSAPTYLQSPEKERRALRVIKWLAFILLIIDHVALGIFNNYRPGRMVGRLAFPLFAYMIAVGMQYSSNKGKYILRILLFAFISEVPYDLVVHKTAFTMSSQNVLFTFFFAMSAVYVARKLNNKWYAWLGSSLVACIVCYLLKTDYGFVGCATVIIFNVGMYGLKGDQLKPLRGQIPGMLMISLGYVIQSSIIYSLKVGHLYIGGTSQLYAIFAFLILLLSKGGKASFTPSDKKYGKLFYLIYPLQFVIIYIIMRVMGIV